MKKFIKMKASKKKQKNSWKYGTKISGMNQLNMNVERIW